jgi:hypothetical protein
MPRYLVTETVEYLVEADDEEHAEQILIGSENPDEYFVQCTDRTVEEADA